MKKFITLFCTLLLCNIAFSQTDVTKFLGIPVDGTKAEMKQQLIRKGFTPNSYNGHDFLEGEFNGADVCIYIVTNNNKVYRIMVREDHVWNEANIKINFNNLVSQFTKNKKYICFEDYTIPEDEDISYNMIVKNKVYDASFFQLPDENKIDTIEFLRRVNQELLKKYTQEQIDNPTEEVKNYIAEICVRYVRECALMKLVWFKISEVGGQYFISIFYDNRYNQADGEDL